MEGAGVRQAPVTVIWCANAHRKFARSSAGPDRGDKGPRTAKQRVAYGRPWTSTSQRGVTVDVIYGVTRIRTPRLVEVQGQARSGQRPRRPPPGSGAELLLLVEPEGFFLGRQRYEGLAVVARPWRIRRLRRASIAAGGWLQTETRVICCPTAPPKFRPGSADSA